MQDEEHLRFPVLRRPYAEDHPLLSVILDKRREAAGTFTPEFSGQRFADFDRGLMCAFEAVNAALQNATRHQAERETLGRMEPVAWLYTSENGKKRVTSFEQWAPHIVAEIGATETPLYALPPAPEAGQ